MVNLLSFIKVSIIFIKIFFLLQSIQHNLDLFIWIECCQYEPDKRPDIHQVISELNILDSNNESDEDSDSFPDFGLSQLQL